MTHRQFPRLRVIGALIAVALAFSVFVSSAATLGGVSPSVLGGTGGVTKHVSAIQLEWNRSEIKAPAQLTTLRLTTGVGEAFAASDVVDVTAVSAGAATCSATTAVSNDTATVDLSFASCPALLWDLSNVAVSISGTRGATTLEGNLGGLRSGLSSFDGVVVQTEAPLSPGYTTVGAGQSERVATATLGVGDATVQQLVGRRAVIIVSNASGQTTSYVGNVGTRTSNQGFWAGTKSGTEVPTVTAELSTLVPGGEAPRTADVTNFRMVLLQPQRLGAGQTASNTHAIVSAGAEVKSSAGGGATDVETALDPVGLDPRLSFTAQRPVNQVKPSLQYCLYFTVTNTSSESVTWNVTFDSSKQPMWGMDPRVTAAGNNIGRQSFWGAEDKAYDAGTGMWTIQGPSWKRSLSPRESQTGGYCLVPPVPAVDASNYQKPLFSVTSDGSFNVSLKVNVTSDSEFLVPWEGEIDLSEFVCPSTLPSRLVGENSVLTKTGPTTYKVTGLTKEYTMFVSKSQPVSFDFARFKAPTDPFATGCK